MKFGLLGPLEVCSGSLVLPIGSARRRVVLAALLLRANQTVATDELVDIVWADAPPSAARNALSVHVAQLRTTLGSIQDNEAVRLVWRSPGYQLQVAPEQIDVCRFTRQVAQARASRAAAAMERAADELRDALALWRGPALADIPSAMLQQVEVARLEASRATAVEERIELDLGLGRHLEVLDELHALVAAQPLRERLRGALMLALYRAGRQAEALAVYQHTRRLLVQELGLEPSRDLQRLEKAILTADPALDLPNPQVVVVAALPEPPTRPVCQLPPDIEDFTGRQELIGEVQCRLAETGQAASTAVAVSAVAGKAGVGKTAVAVHVAHQLRFAFPDGQLYVRMHGSQARPLDAADVLARLLRDLGVHSAAIPEAAEDRSGLYRAWLADRRVLIVLDDAHDEAQVRPLLPGAPGCGVLVTSRRMLAGLEGANLVTLDVFSAAEAMELLGKLAGPGRMAAELQAAEAITRLCGCLPLAVRIAGAKLAANPRWRLGGLVQRLTDERRRLGELRIGDLDVRASLALSYQGQNGSGRQLFRLLGMLGLPSFPGWVAAALLDAAPRDAAALLDQLVDAQLVEAVGYDGVGQLRYRLHDLLRIFARERLDHEEDAAARQSALQRVLGAYLTLAETSRHPLVVRRITPRSRT